jgi:Na+/H+ antiporter NhaD/arsenite permease-like protein
MALLVGVNPGCYLTLIGALAGLMWNQIIKSQPGAQKLKCPTGWDLTYYGALVITPVIFATCLSISVISPLFG